MAAGIAHEIRNPLASMSGSIQVLRQELPLSEEQAQLMDIVLRESERLNDTIRSFLAYARPQRFAVARLDVRKVVQDAALLLRNSADVRDGHVVDVDVPDEPVWYEADENQIRQIVWNLATNGLRAMSGGGRLSARRGRPDGARRSCSRCEDQGCGIPADELDSIFQPFRSSFEKGTGLGLAIVHRIVTDYNGAIQVSSTVGSGTTVRVRLPVPRDRDGGRRDDAIRHEPRRAARRRRSRTRRPSKPRILVVDDEPSMREMLRIVLRRDGYDVVLAENGRQAHRAPAARAGRPAAVGHPDAGRQRRRRAARRQGAEPRHRRVHDDGVRVDRHRGRGDAARRRRLLHEAVQHGRAAAEDAAAPRDAAG